MAVNESNSNPVYYVQYAYARISSLFRKCENFSFVNEFKTIDLEKTKKMIMCLLQYPNVIKEAANVLIKTQIENTEIIRTNGNEFLIYMVEYEEKQANAYIKKLNKEFKLSSLFFFI